MSGGAAVDDNGLVSADREPRVDLHSHAGRCFLARLPAGHSAVATMGAAAVADAIRAARAAGMTALVLSAVADFPVLRPNPATGLRVHRDFRVGEAYEDTQRQLADLGTEIIRLAVAAGPDHVVLGTDLDGNYRPVLTSYDQLDDLTALLAVRGLPTARIQQILGDNALKLLARML